MSEWMMGGSGLILGLLAGIELSRVLWQREILALEIQLRRATEELARERPAPVRLRVVEDEPGGAV